MIHEMKEEKVHAGIFYHSKLDELKKAFWKKFKIVQAGGGLVHLNVASALFLAVNLTKRNLFEVSVVCFLICIASELRAHALPGNELSTGIKKA